MTEDLERVLALQKLETAAETARRRLADEPERDKALTARLDAARDQLAAGKARVAGNQNARRTIEKDVALHQSRLSKFREQAMAVKTNQEYHAIQKEISFAQGEIKGLEDRILELMIEADDLNVAARTAEAALGSEQNAVDAARKEMTAEHAELEAFLARVSQERAGLVAGLGPGLLALFDQVARKRGGIAVAEARDGVCTICHVRLRPQVFNTVRRNDQIVQCETCQRILYFVPKAVAPAVDAQPSSAEPRPSNP